MTPEEKAKDIFDSYWYCLMQSDIKNRSNWSKECALIAVDEILEMHLPILEEDADEFYDYWEEVKQEIEKL